MKTALVLGAGGFIGSHMVRRLKAEGYWVRGVDLKYPEFSKSEADHFLIYDLTDRRNVEAVMRLSIRPERWSYLPQPFDELNTFDEVYQFAADMGGAGYIFTGEHDAQLMHNSALINLNVAHYARHCRVGKIFYSSSACIYPKESQEGQYAPILGSEVGVFKNFSLSEDDAYPANPDSEYGWEKLFSERLYLAYQRNHGLNVRIARFHNIYGPEGTYQGGREKAPAAICRKVIESDGSIEIWGDGEQTRSFLYIDDCINAVRLLMESDYKEPINIGSEAMVTINQLAGIAISFTDRAISIKHVEGPQGVRGRNSNNDLIRQVLPEWKIQYSLFDGMEKLYHWIAQQYDRH